MQRGGELMPKSGTITRAQYVEAANKRMEAMRANGGGGFNRGGGFGGAPNATPMIVRTGDANTPGMTMTIQPAMAPPIMERVVSDEELQRKFADLDKDRDGRISLQEAQESGKLRSNFAYYAKSKPGYLDMPT
jgi:hypothetical protein